MRWFCLLNNASPQKSGCDKPMNFRRICAVHTSILYRNHGQLQFDLNLHDKPWKLNLDTETKRWMSPFNYGYVSCPSEIWRCVCCVCHLMNPFRIYQAKWPWIKLITVDHLAFIRSQRCISSISTYVLSFKLKCIIFLRRAPIVASFEVTPKNLGGVWQERNRWSEARIVKLSTLPIFFIKLQHVAEGERSISSQFTSATWTMSSTLNHTGLSFISRTPSASTRGVT